MVIEVSERNRGRAMRYLYGHSIGNDISSLDPTHIKVAYLGSGWVNFIRNPMAIQKIIVQPNPPTDPKALCQIANIIGWDRIRLMNNIHAKVYIHLNADNSGEAVVGSPNLSQNGLGGGLYEAAIAFDFSSSEEGGVELMQGFNDAWEMAGSEYPTQQDKLAKIASLQEDFESWKEHNHPTHQARGNLDCENNFPLLCWYSPGRDWKVAEEAKLHLPTELEGFSLEEAIEHSIDIESEADRIFFSNQIGRWVIIFRKHRGGPNPQLGRIYGVIEKAFYYTDDPKSVLGSALIEYDDEAAPFDAEEKIFRNEFKRLAFDRRYSDIFSENYEFYWSDERIQLMKSFCLELRQCGVL
ncbi:phospholipase D family protein [Imhoffiella purpurea]|uniref:phospholipase D family protein n=1 Tax=Imhoffiella purpurea TaxID=1249627 RepID=UPI0012FE746C|nr:phospholipase D family protein [Imhoffiella purpurea]